MLPKYTKGETPYTKKNVLKKKAIASRTDYGEKKPEDKDHAYHCKDIDCPFTPKIFTSKTDFFAKHGLHPIY